MSTDDVLSLIDGAILDYTTSGDAMRWTPEPEGSPSEDLQIRGRSGSIRSRLVVRDYTGAPIFTHPAEETDESRYPCGHDDPDRIWADYQRYERQRFNDFMAGMFPPGAVVEIDDLTRPDGGPTYGRVVQMGRTLGVEPSDTFMFRFVSGGGSDGSGSSIATGANGVSGSAELLGAPARGELASQPVEGHPLMPQVPTYRDRRPRHQSPYGPRRGHR